MSTLSERFSQLKGTTGAIKKPGDKTVQRKIEQASSRNQKTQQRRGIPINGTVPKGKKAPTKVKGIASNGKGKKGPGKKGKDAKEKPKTAAELDMEMAKYWHAAGKGPNPDVVNLDNEMDEYFKKKEAGETAAAAEPSAIN